MFERVSKKWTLRNAHKNNNDNMNNKIYYYLSPSSLTISQYFHVGKNRTKSRMWIDLCGLLLLVRVEFEKTTTRVVWINATYWKSVEWAVPIQHCDSTWILLISRSTEPILCAYVKVNWPLIKLEGFIYVRTLVLLIFEVLSEL